MAMNGLSRAAESMRGNITPAICANSGRFMDKFSNGRYRNLSVSGEMDVSIIDERGMTTTVEMMSGGTCDAAYIALRMALAMQIFGGDMPPLMMDETLCQLDDERAERILSMLSSLCADGIQCLLFTCHRREGEICASSSIRSSIIKM
jgi:uncharacterized protein YhaN